MGLLGTIQQAKSGLEVAQLGLHVVGNNVANANTPGYIRQNLEQAASISTREGNLIKGHGVLPTGIVQIVDKALAERMMNAKTAVVGAEMLEKAFNQLENLSSDLDNSGLSQQFTQFNNAIHELSAQPGDTSLREFVVLQGETLATNIRRTRQNAIDQQGSWDGEMKQMASDINRLTERVAELNLQIATLEGSGNSDATGLRDQRYLALESLSEYMQINYQEQESGVINVFVGGDYLVSNSNHREVYSTYNQEAGGQEVRILETDSPLQVTGGKLSASIEARDGVFGEYVDRLDTMTASLIRTVNEVHSQGQGRQGFQAVISSSQGEAGVPLNVAGLPFIPDNGTFDMNVVDDQGKVISTHQIKVRRLGQVSDSTINSIVSDIDAIEGISASVSRDGNIEILSDSLTSGFTFGEDTSGFLAAAGINTFFSGKNAIDINVNQALKEDSDLLAISRGGIGEDTDVLTNLLDLVDRPLDELDGRSVRGIYEGSLSTLGQRVGLQASEAEGLRNYHASLHSQHLAITGVNIDEESIKMLSYQRAFQASSRVISTAAEMLDILINL